MSLGNHLMCSICMDSFTDPVTTACGHSYCKTCLDFSMIYHDQMCPLCKTPVFKIPKVNIVLRDIIQDHRDARATAKAQEAEAGEVACDVCPQPKHRALKSCLVCLTSYCSVHLQNHSTAARLKGHRLVAPVDDLDQRACLKHGRPLQLYSRAQQACICVRCTEEHREEELVSTEEEWRKRKENIEDQKSELDKKIWIRERQMDELNRCLKSFKVELDDEWHKIESVFIEILSIVEEVQWKILLPMSVRRSEVTKQAEKLRNQLDSEILGLKSIVSQLDDITTLEDHVHFLQKHLSLEDLEDIIERSEVNLDTSLCFGTMRKSTSVMMERLQEELEKLTVIELKRAATFSVDVQLDPSTAHPHLVLSEDGKEVMDGGKDQDVTDTTQRFDMFGSLLGVNSLTSGRAYWEVQVHNKSGWDLGVARGDANRRGKLTLSPENGYWAAVHYESDKYAALTAPPRRLPLPAKPEKVGVFVDYEEGLVSFYNVTARSHIFSFADCSFVGDIFPYFSPHVEQGEENGRPLIISPVKPGAYDADESGLGLIWLFCPEAN